MLFNLFLFEINVICLLFGEIEGWIFYVKFWVSGVVLLLFMFILYKLFSMLKIIYLLFGVMFKLDYVVLFVLIVILFNV